LNNANNEDDSLVRPARFTSHALAEVRKFKHLPFFCHSAVLLDISLGGFKLEFTGEAMTKPGEQYWLSIPLSPLGIYAPSRLICRSEVRWFDDKRHRIGGVFMEATKKDQMIIEQIIDSLRKRGALK
jgi:hypothetical protein